MDLSGDLGRLFERWRITETIAVADTPTSRVLRARLADGGTAIVKDLKPIGIADELRGADLLDWRDGRGYVRLLAREGSILMLEDAGDRSLLDHLDAHGDTAATQIAADLLRAMHHPLTAPAPATLESLPVRFDSLFERGARADADPILVEGAAMARALLADQRGLLPLHGDLHHENIHLSPRGWLALDPKGLRGDPGYDAANMFNNPLDRDDLRLDPARIEAMAGALAPAVGRDPATVLRWAVAHACLSASWYLEGGNDGGARRSMAVARAVRSVLGAR